MQPSVRFFVEYCAKFRITRNPRSPAMASVRLRTVKDKLQLKGDDTRHEQTDSWSNRDLIPLPPVRRTWVTFHYFGYWAISSLNVSNWQTPNTYLSMSNPQNMHRSFADVINSCRTIRWSVDGSHRHFQSSYCSVLNFSCLVWTEMAYRLHNSKQIYMGLAGELHSPVAEDLTQFYLDSCSMYDRHMLLPPLLCRTLILF